MPLAFNIRPFVWVNINRMANINLKQNVVVWIRDCIDCIDPKDLFLNIGAVIEQNGYSCGYANLQTKDG